MMNAQSKQYKDNKDTFSQAQLFGCTPASADITATLPMRAVDAWVSSTGCLILPSLLKSCFTESDLRGDNKNKTNYLFSTKVSLTVCVLSSSRLCIPSSHDGQKRAKKGPVCPPPSLFTSSYYLSQSLFVFTTVSFVIPSQPSHFLLVIMSKSAWKLLVTKVSLQCLKSNKAQGLFLLTSKAVWLAASSAATSHPQSRIGERITRSDTAVCVYYGILIVGRAVSK